MEQRVSETSDLPTLTRYTVRRESPLRLNVATWPGPATALPLLLLHGIWDSWQTFSSVAAQLASERTIYALDFRGHGDSDKPATGYALDDYAGDMAALLPALGPERIALLGFSLGALVAGHLAADRPAWLDRLILEDPPLSPDVDPRGREEWFRLLLDLKGRPFAEVVDALGDLYPTRDRVTNEQSARNLLNTADGPFRELLGSGSGADELARWTAINVPTCILRAAPKGFPAVGGALSVAGRDALQQALPRATVIEFSGSGHLIHAEQEARFLDAVRAFLADEG